MVHNASLPLLATSPPSSPPPPLPPLLPHLGISSLGHVHDVVLSEVALTRWRRTNAICLISLSAITSHVMCLLSNKYASSAITHIHNMPHQPVSNNNKSCTADCRSLVTLEFLPRSHQPIRFVVTSLQANLIGSRDLGSTFLVTSDLQSAVICLLSNNTHTQYASSAWKEQ